MPLYIKTIFKANLCFFFELANRAAKGAVLVQGDPLGLKILSHPVEGSLSHMLLVKPSTIKTIFGGDL